MNTSNYPEQPQNFPLPPTVRPEMTEAFFRKWSTILRRISDEFPNIVLFTPDGVKTSSFVARVRDAILNCKRNNWSSSWDQSKIKANCFDVLSTENGDVMVKFKRTDTLPVGKVDTLITKLSSNPLSDVRTYDYDEKLVLAFCELKQRDIFKEKTLIRNMPEAMISFIEENYSNVLTHQVSTGETLIL